MNNVETLANVPGILAEGVDWFREMGTDESPGTTGLHDHRIDRPRRRRRGGYRNAASARRSSSSVGEPSPATASRAVSAVSRTRSSPTAPRHAADLRGHGAAERARAAVRSSCATIGPTSPPSAPGWPGSSPSSRAASARRASATGSRSPRCSTTCVARRPTSRRRRAIDDHLTTVTDGARCNLASQYQAVLGSVVDEFGDELRAPRAGRHRPPSS